MKMYQDKNEEVYKMEDRIRGMKEDMEKMEKKIINFENKIEEMKIVKERMEN